MIAVNQKGLLYVTHAALPHLLTAAKDGLRKVADIVNISSIAGRVAWANFGVYNTLREPTYFCTNRLRGRDAPLRPSPITVRGNPMAAWSADHLKAITENDDLFVSPFREDGTTYGTPTQTWGLVVDGKVYVRAANGPKSRWYQAAITQKAGRVRVAGQYYDVTFEAAGDENEAAIDAAYEAKYPGSPAVLIMQGEGPKSASVRISAR